MTSQTLTAKFFDKVIEKLDNATSSQSLGKISEFIESYFHGETEKAASYFNLLTSSISTMPHLNEILRLREIVGHPVLVEIMKILDVFHSQVFNSFDVDGEMMFPVKMLAFGNLGFSKQGTNKRDLVKFDKRSSFKQLPKDQKSVAIWLADYKNHLLDANSMAGSRDNQGAYFNYSSVRNIVRNLGIALEKASEVVTEKYESQELEGDEHFIFPNLSDPGGRNKVITDLTNWRINVDIQEFTSEAPEIEFFSVGHVENLISNSSTKSNASRGRKPKSAIK